MELPIEKDNSHTPSILFSTLIATVNHAQTKKPKHLKDKPLIIDVLKKYISDYENVNKGDGAIAWEDLQAYLANSAGDVLSFLTQEQRYFGFTYEVLKWAGLLEIFEAVVPGKILFAIQDGIKLMKDKYEILCFLDQLAVWGENPYITSLYAFSQFLNYETLAECRDRIVRLDPTLFNNPEYFDLLVRRGVLNQHIKRSLFPSEREDLPNEIVILLAKHCLTGQHRKSLSALKTLRSLKNTCRSTFFALQNEYAECAPKGKLLFRGDSSAYLSEHGALWMWGRKSYGLYHLNPEENCQRIPVQLTNLPIKSRIKDFQLTSERVGFLLENGEIWVTLRTTLYLGIDILQPLIFPRGLRAVQFIVNERIGCLLNNGEIWEMVPEELNKQMRPTPVRIEGLPRNLHVAQYRLGRLCSGCLLQHGEVWMWGNNLCRQLGNGTYNDDVAPPARIIGIPGGSHVVQLEVGDYHCGCILDNGTIMMWGRNENGELGIGRVSPSHPQPTEVKGLPNNIRVAKLILQYGQSGCILDNGEAWVWGKNSIGQDPNEPSFSPWQAVKVTGLPNNCRVMQLKLGARCSGCILDNGEAWVWGEIFTDRYGGRQIKYQPWKIPGIREGRHVIQLQLGSEHIGCVLDNNEIWVVGGNSKGQLGNGVKSIAELQMSKLSGINQPITCDSSRSDCSSHILHIK